MGFLDAENSSSLLFHDACELGKFGVVIIQMDAFNVTCSNTVESNWSSVCSAGVMACTLFVGFELRWDGSDARM